MQPFRNAFQAISLVAAISAASLSASAPGLAQYSRMPAQNEAPQGSGARALAERLAQGHATKNRPRTPPTVPRPGSPTVACYQLAKLRAHLSDEAAIRLCRCARSTRRVECYVDARIRAYLDEDRAIELCTGGYGNTLDCLAD